MSQLATPEAESLLAEVSEITAEIERLGDATGALKRYRVELCRRARAAGATTTALGDASKVSSVAVTQWLGTPKVAAKPTRGRRSA